MWMQGENLRERPRAGAALALRQFAGRQRRGDWNVYP